MVSPATPGVPSNSARLSPTFAVMTLPPTSKQATAHDPLLSFPPPFYAISKNFSSHFSKASFKACQGLLSRFFDLSSRAARLSLRNSAQADPPCPSKTAQRSKFSLRGRMQGLESLRHKQRSQWQLRLPCRLLTQYFRASSPQFFFSLSAQTVRNLLRFSFSLISRLDLSRFQERQSQRSGSFLKSVEMCFRLQCSILGNRSKGLRGRSSDSLFRKNGRKICISAVLAARQPVI